MSEVVGRMSVHNFREKSPICRKCFFLGGTRWLQNQTLFYFRVNFLRGQKTLFAILALPLPSTGWNESTLSKQSCQLTQQHQINNPGENSLEKICECLDSNQGLLSVRQILFLCAGIFKQNGLLN